MTCSDKDDCSAHAAHLRPNPFLLFKDADRKSVV